MTRLDTFLSQKGLTQSRNRAKELIKNSLVVVDGKIITRASFMVDDPDIKIISQNSYVSRAGEKLKAFLEEHPVDIKGEVCLDVGSSTGGFVEVLLEFGAQEVVAIDVGRDQLHQKLRENPKVVSMEGCDIRGYKPDREFGVVSCDLSFIGSENFLSDIDRVSSKDIIVLFKPQFEVGVGVKRDRKGVVKDEEAIILASKKFITKAKEFGWTLKKSLNSAIKGKEGNVEIFYHFTK